MPVVPASNSYTLGIHKQTNEATPGTVADYSLPVYSSEFGPVEELQRIAVTDGASMQGDPFKGPQSWSAQFEHPAYGSALGRELQSLWPTDTISGAGPFVHTYSGLGGTQPWVSGYVNWVNAGAFSQTFAAGLCSGMTFSSTAEGGPLRIGYSLIGQTTTVAAFTVTNVETLALGYFQMQATGAKIELDLDTPDVNPSTQPEKVRNVSISVERSVGPEPVADAFAVTNLSQGIVVPSGSMEFLWTSFDAYRATYFGAVAGSAGSPTIVYGALELTWKHSVQSGWLFTLYMPRVAFRCGIPTPDPGGAAIALPITLEIAKPATGDHVVPILTNGTTPAY